MANAIPHKLRYQDCPHSIQYLTNDCLIPLGKRLTPRCMLTAFCWGRAFVATWRAAFPNAASRSQTRIAIRGFGSLHYVAFSNCHPRGAKNCRNEIMSTFASDNPVKSIG